MPLCLPSLSDLFNGSPISAQPCEPTLPRTILPSPECPAYSIQREKKSISRLVQGKICRKKEPETERQNKAWVGKRSWKEGWE